MAIPPKHNYPARVRVKIEFRDDGFPSVSRVEFEDEDDPDDQSHVVDVAWGIRWALDMFHSGNEDRTLKTLAKVMGDIQPAWSLVDRLKELHLESLKNEEDKEVFEALVSVHESAVRYKELIDKRDERAKKILDGDKDGECDE